MPLRLAPRPATASDSSAGIRPVSVADAVRTARSGTADAAMIMPLTMSPPLKKPLERSPVMPRRLKYSRHHP